MGFLYESMVRPVLFRRKDVEAAHDLGVTAMEMLSRVPFLCALMERYNLPARAKPIEVFGLSFPNAVGLAAGMDKNARFWRAMGALGFGHAEIGTVTFHKQPGNDRPRLFRYPEHGAIVNRMGFNNDGAEAVAERLKASRRRMGRIPLGVNIGKSRVTPLDQAVGDYLGSFRLLADHADYIAINVSSPNTPELRRLQERDYLDTLLVELMAENQRRAGGARPVLLKIAPDLSFREIDDIIETTFAHGLSGIIATNTTIERPKELRRNSETGGLSGLPLQARAREIVRYIVRATQGRLPVIGVGGIDGAVSAGRMLDEGAVLVQLYTGMIFRGPFVAAEIGKGLATRQRDWVY